MIKKLFIFIAVTGALFGAKMEIPKEPSMEEYQKIMSKTMNEIKSQGVTHSIFGDIFLGDLRVYREEQLQAIGMQAVFPLWKQNTSNLIHEFLDLGFKTYNPANEANQKWFKEWNLSKTVLNVGINYPF